MPQQDPEISKNKHTQVKLIEMIHCCIEEQIITTLYFCFPFWRANLPEQCLLQPGAGLSQEQFCYHLHALAFHALLRFPLHTPCQFDNPNLRVKMSKTEYKLILLFLFERCA